MDIRCLKKIKGFISDRELAFLYNQAKKINGVILEIGSWAGRSTIALALGAKAGRQAEVYAIDCSLPLEFYKNIREYGVEKVVSPLVESEQEAIKKWGLPISLFFSDVHYGDEKNLDIMMTNWLPHLEEGGVIALNNVRPNFKGIFEGLPLWGLPAPKKIGKKYILYSGQFKNCGLAGIILYGIKCSKINFIDKIRNRVVSWKIDFYSFLFKIYLISKKIPSPLKKKIRSVILKLLK